MALGMDASAGAPKRGRSEQLTERRRRQRRQTDPDLAIRAGIAGDAALATLDKFNRGVILLDTAGVVCFANHAAEAMLARNDGLRLRHHRLEFDVAEANAALQALVAEGRRAADGGGVVLRVENSRRMGAYRVLVSPLTPRSVRDEKGAGYCVFVYEPNGGQKPLQVLMLKTLYRLTTAEARLANELFLGKHLAEAATACGISLNTAKSTLKCIFHKCAVSSQSELLLLFSLGPRTL